MVNVKVLETMEEKWQQRFITWGMLIGVFGMRFLFPIVIVAIASGTGLWETFNMAFNDASRLVGTEKLIFAFGGAFLLMVFFNFLFDEEREDKWIKVIEESKLLLHMGKISSIQMLLSVLVGLILIILTSSHVCKKFDHLHVKTRDFS